MTLFIYFIISSSIGIITPNNIINDFAMPEVKVNDNRMKFIRYAYTCD